MTIELHLIHDGDEVEIEDKQGNRARGPVSVDHNHGTFRLVIGAFGGKIPFAQHKPAGWTRVGGNTVRWHQSTLFDTVESS